MNMADRVAIGIDLGTTNSCVGVFINGKVEILADRQGSRVTPSVVAFTDQQRLVGEQAVLQTAVNPTNTLHDVKRIIGQKMHQIDVKSLPYRVEGNNNKVQIKVTWKNEEKTFNPEEISAMVLTRMKSIAEDYLGHKVHKAVITIPAHFGDAQRQATKLAGEIAGLEVIRIINEPTAAAMAYGIHKQPDLLEEEEKSVLVFDLGGGTFDVSLLEVTSDGIEVKATDGDLRLGGEDFNSLLVEHFTKEISRKYGKSIDGNPKALRRLRNGCERAKCDLSAQMETRIEIESLTEGFTFSTKLTRAKFEEICKHLFRKTLRHVDGVLKDGGLRPDQVDEVILVGGSTRIPKVQNLLKEHFNGKSLNKSLHPDEAVAYGASIQAAILTRPNDRSLRNMLLLDVINLSLGVEVVGGLMSVLLKKNSLIPTKVTKGYTTIENYQTSIRFLVYEGERAVTSGNNLLGSFGLRGITRAESGVPDVKVTFDIDSNGILSVSAKEALSGSENKIVIDSNKNEFSPQEVKKMVKNAKLFMLEDSKECERISEREHLRKFCNFLQVQLAKKNFLNLDSDQIASLERLRSDVRLWFDSNPQAHILDFRVRLKVLSDACASIKDLSFDKTKSKRSRSGPSSKYTQDMKEGEKIFVQVNKSKEDLLRACNFFTNAYSSAKRESLTKESVWSQEKVGLVYLELAAREHDQERKAEQLITAANCLALSLFNAWKLSEDDPIISWSSSGQSKVKKCFEMLLLTLSRVSEAKKWVYLEKFISHCGKTEENLPSSWNKMISGFREQQAELLLKKAVGFVTKNDFKNGLSQLHEMKKPMNDVEAIQLILGKSSQKYIDLLDKSKKYTAIAQAMQSLENCRLTLREAKEATNSDKRLNFALNLLDELKRAKASVRDFKLELFCEIQVFESGLYLEYLDDRSTAKVLLKEVLDLAVAGGIDGPNSKDWYKEAVETLKQIQANDDSTSGENVHDELMEQLKPKLDLLHKHKKDSNESFLQFLHKQFPPSHNPMYESVQKLFYAAANWKRIFKKLVFLYHPDKVDKSKFGKKQYLLCEEITKVLTEKYKNA